MRKAFTYSNGILAFAIALIFFVACTKSDISSTGDKIALVEQNDLSADLLKSSEFSNFVKATNSIVQAVDFGALNKKDAGAVDNFVNSKQQLTRQDFTHFLELQHINPSVYFINSDLQKKSIKDFQAKYKLSNEQNAALWQTVILNHHELFTVDARFEFPNINELLTCLTNTATEFAATTAVCLALREIPIIGEQLYEACETEAIDALIDNLLGCFGL